MRQRLILFKIKGVQAVFVALQPQHPHQRQGAAAPVLRVVRAVVLDAVFGLAVFPVGAGHDLGDARQGDAVKVFALLDQQELARAAVFAGINRARMLMYSYALTGLLAAMAGIILSGRTNAAKSDYGASYLLQAVLIAVLGGTNPAGGRGNVLGVVLALISLVMLSSGFQMMRVSNHLIDFIWGAFLIGVLVLNYLLSNRKEG